MRINNSPKYKRRRRIALVVFSLLLVLNTIFLVKTIKKFTNKNITNNTKKSDNTHMKNTKKNVDINKDVLLSFAGDCTLGTDTSFGYNQSMPAVLENNNMDYSYLFKNVSSIFKADDATIVNLETTLTNATKKIPKTFNFKANPEYAKALTLGSIELVNISNNHIYDYGDKGVEDTLRTLKNNNISYFGEGNKIIREIQNIKFGFLGYLGFEDNEDIRSKIKKDIEDLKNKGCAIITINFHWGIEGQYEPIDTQKNLAYFSIDNGADLIIGHHPHIVQGLEQYKNKIICYSLGNFCFGGNFNPKDKDTFIFQMKYNFKNEKLNEQNIKIIPCRISSVNYMNDYCPTPLEEDEKERVLSKINRLSNNLPKKLNKDFININVKR